MPVICLGFDFAFLIPERYAFSGAEAVSEASEVAGGRSIADRSGWQELWRTEDWWAVWLGLGLTAVAYLLFVNGSSLMGRHLAAWRPVVG